jgi:hypothetical protein
LLADTYPTDTYIFLQERRLLVGSRAIAPAARNRCDSLVHAVEQLAA